MNIQKILWVVLFLGFFFNFGAYILTITSIGSNDLIEANGFMAAIFEYNYLLGIVPLILAYLAVILAQKRLIKISSGYTYWKKNLAISLLPIIVTILFGMDFFHDLFLIYFNIGIFNELGYILIFR